MMKIVLLLMFSIFAIAGVYMAAISERVAVAFVYVLLTLVCGFIATYIALEKKNLL